MRGSRLSAVSCQLSATLLATVLLGAPAAADPVTLRMAAVAPDGTQWARELKAFARDVELSTHGELRVKWYLSGIAGDELTALERVRHGQLDGEAGAIFCQRLAPSLRVVRLVGLYDTRKEAVFVMNRLKPVLDEEFRKAGFANLGESVFGADALFSRAPIRTLADLKAQKVWTWNIDPVWQTTFAELGVRSVTTSLDELAGAYGRHAFDAFFAVPSAALAYQWSTQARYVVDTGAAILPACIALSNAAMDPLPTEEKQAVQAAATRLMIRFNDTSAMLDDALMNGLFEKQGLKKVDAPKLRPELFQAAAAARRKLGAALVAPALLATVEKLLDEYRSQPRAEVNRR